ncbi:UNVERIFIED_ORG: type I restriction enzyme S subunit [Rhizobium esperanzae]
MPEKPTMKIGELASGVRGVSYRPEHLQEHVGPYRTVLLRSTNIQGGQLDLEAIQIVPDYLVKPPQMVREGDLVVCMSNGSKALVGKAARYGGGFGSPLTVGAFCSVFHPKLTSDSSFLHHVFQGEQFRRSIDIILSGSAINNLKNSDVEGIPVTDHTPVARAKIAEILDALDDAILETDAVIEKLRTIRIGLTDDLLTRGLANDGSPRDLPTLAETAVGPRPATWTVANLGRFVAGAEYGTNLSLGDSSAGIPVLRMNNIQDGEFDLSDLKYAPAHAVERFRVQRNDVLFNRTNSWEHVGKAAIWRGDEPGPAFASYLVRLHCGHALQPEFLHLWLNWAPVQRSIRQFATPGVQQVNINPTNLRRALIAVPDTLEEQRAIIERVNGVAAAIEDHRRQRVKLSSLREGLRDDLLTGRKPVAAIREAAE